MTSNGDHNPSAHSPPSTMGSNKHSNGNGFDYWLDNFSVGEVYESAGNTDTAGRGGREERVLVTSDGFGSTPKSGPSEEYSGSARPPRFSHANDEQLANLIDLNNTLVLKVSVLRGEKETLTEKLAHLDEQLRTVRANQEWDAQEALRAVQSEKKELVNEKTRLEVELHASVTERKSLENEAVVTEQFIQGLKKDHSSLLAEKAALEETNRVFETKAKDALKACEALRAEHGSLLDERGQLKQRAVKLEMERDVLETEVSEVTGNLSELKRVHDEMLEEQLELEREKELSLEKNRQYRIEVEEARRVITMLEAKVEALSHDLKLLEQQKLAAVEAQANVVRRAAELNEEKVAMSSRLVALEDEKSQLELALEESEHQLSVSKSRVKDAEQASTATTLPMAKLEQELNGLHHLHLELSKEHSSLRVQHSDANKEIKRLSTLNAQLDDELHVTLDSLKAGEEQLTVSRRLIEELRGQLDKEKEQTRKLEVLLAESAAELKAKSRIELEEMEERRKTEKTLAATSKELVEVSRGKDELRLRVHDLEGTVGKLTEELSVANKSAEEATRRIEKEAKTTGALQTEVADLCAVKKTLEEELSEAKSCIQKMQADLSSTRSSLMDMELQLGEFLKERKSLSDVKSSLELELRRMSSTSSETAEKVEEELRMWRDKVEELADSLEKARTTAGTYEKRAWALISELQSLKQLVRRNSRWSKVCYPAAAVSGAAALAAGISFYRYKTASCGR